ncbi:hypothetical protein AB9F42_34625, partial [Rhizobium leguminosarum]
LCHLDFFSPGLRRRLGVETSLFEEIEMAKTIKEKTGIPGFGLSAKTFDKTMHQFMHWVYTNNGKVIDADGKVTLDSPQILAALKAY